jgi:hypothetical protein
MRDRETIDSELRLLVAVRRVCREHDGRVPSTRLIDVLLDERGGLTGYTSRDMTGANDGAYCHCQSHHHRGTCLSSDSVAASCAGALRMSAGLAASPDKRSSLPNGTAAASGHRAALPNHLEHALPCAESGLVFWGPFRVDLTLGGTRRTALPPGNGVGGVVLAC